MSEPEDKHDVIAATLPADAARAWEAFCAVERVGVRSEAKRSLDELLVVMDGLDPGSLDAFVHAYCTQAIEGSGFSRTVPVRFPLLAKIVAPALMRGRARGSARHVLWISAVWGILFRLPEWRTMVGANTTPRSLLEEAFELEPSEETRKRLIHHILNGIEYDLHELPCLLSDEVEIRSELARLKELLAMAPVPEAGESYIAAVERILAGDRSDDAINGYFDAQLPGGAA